MNGLPGFVGFFQLKSPDAGLVVSLFSFFDDVSQISLIIQFIHHVLLGDMLSQPLYIGMLFGVILMSLDLLYQHVPRWQRLLFIQNCFCLLCPV